MKPCMVCGKELDDEKMNVCDDCHKKNMEESQRIFKREGDIFVYDGPKEMSERD